VKERSLLKTKYICESREEYECDDEVLKMLGCVMSDRRGSCRESSLRSSFLRPCILFYVMLIGVRVSSVP